jgi:hypothetical protein
VKKFENQFWFLEYVMEDDNYDQCLYYDFTKKKWVRRKELTISWDPTEFPCRSYRAAKRHLRKHDEIPKGTKFRLVSPFVGYDRYLIK